MYTYSICYAPTYTLQHKRCTHTAYTTHPCIHYNANVAFSLLFLLGTYFVNIDISKTFEKTSGHTSGVARFVGALVQSFASVVGS